MTKARDIREMSDEQIRLVWKDAAEALFRLRLQAQTEKLAKPSELAKNRRTIARCQTILAQRGSVVAPTDNADGTAATHGDTRRDKHAKRRRPGGRGALRAAGKAGVVMRRRVQKRSQSGT